MGRQKEADGESSSLLLYSSHEDETQFNKELSCKFNTNYKQIIYLSLSGLSVFHQNDGDFIQQ